jgi:peptidoglycan/LPS O-acetylase OafA/YrhL
MRDEQNTTAESGRLGGIDALRGIAIVAVLLCHLTGVVPWCRTKVLEPGFADGRWLAKAMENGMFGVDLFFILSGFVLYLPFAGGRRDIGCGADAIRFYRHRIARIYPLFILAVLLPLGLRHPFVSPWDLLVELELMFSGLFVFSAGNYMPDYNTPLWSLGTEIWFGALFPALVVIRRIAGWPTLLAGTAMVSLVCRGWAPSPVGEWLPAAVDAGPHVVAAKLCSALVLGRLDDFVLGMYLAELHVLGVLDRLRPWRWALLGSGAAAFALTVPWRGGAWNGVGPGSPWLISLVQAGSAGLLIAWLTWPPGMMRALLWNAPLRMAGVMCFSIYVWHAPVMNAFLSRVFTWDRFWVWLILTTAISLATAAFVERVIPVRPKRSAT